jgi:hypothetical protein
LNHKFPATLAFQQQLNLTVFEMDAVMMMMALLPEIYLRLSKVNINATLRLL